MKTFRIFKKILGRLTPYFIGYILLINVTYCSDSPKTTVSLISNFDSISRGTDLIIGVRFKLPKGWTTFWRTPGDVGYGANFNWTGSKNIDKISVLWPYPKREKIYEFITNVYENEVVFPIKIIPKNFQDPLLIKLDIDYLLCQKGACVPQRKIVSLSLPVGNGQHTKDFSLLNKAMEQIPKTGNTDKLSLNNVTIIKLTDDTATLKINVNSNENLSRSSIFFEGSKEILFGEPKLTITNNKATYFTVNVEKNDPSSNETMSSLLKKPLLITLVNHNEAITVPGTVQFDNDINPPKKSITQNKMTPIAINSGNTANNTQNHQFISANVSQDKERSIGSLLFFSFLGGLILNLMPCVFPILSLKVLTLRTVDNKKLQGLFYTLGVMVTFLIIALIIIVLQSAGKLVGWGFQMQSPIFIISLIFLFTLISFNLFGLYEVPFSLKVQPKWHKHHQLMYSFSTGILACVVSTPCSAPFMATAIGAAFYKGSWSAIIIFLTLGFGFALPYLLLCIIPQTKMLFPRPGPWMEQLKQFLGFPMVLSVIWLLWVIGYQINYDSIIMLLISLCSLGFTLWVLKSIKGKTLRLIFILLSLTLVIYPLYWINHQMNQHLQKIEVEEYSPEKLQSLLDQNHKVFVYATAAWCITCKMNDTIAIETKEAQEYFKKNHIVLMKADWTNKNNAILGYLQSFNRAGVPLYVYYPGSKTAYVLPQILTASILINSLENIPTKQSSLPKEADY